jgi:glucosamine-6-phosphate deaminase
MEIVVLRDSLAVDAMAAALVAHALRRKPSLTLGFDGGIQLKGLCDTLASMHREEGLDFSLCKVFCSAEYMGTKASKKDSRCMVLWSQLLSRVNIDLRNFYSPNGEASDLDSECHRYEDRVREMGGIDVQVLVLGGAGNLALNEPLSPLASRTHVTPLSPLLNYDISRSAINTDGSPHYGITAGLGTLLDADRCLFLACGRRHAEFLAKALEGPVTSVFSASVLQLHRNCTALVDESAATLLQGVDHYRWMYEHDFKWKPFRKTIDDVSK